jgi:hypothetical protein
MTCDPRSVPAVFIDMFTVKRRRGAPTRKSVVKK